MTCAVPGIHPYFYIGSKALNHTEEYTEASGTFRALASVILLFPEGNGFALIFSFFSFFF